MYALSNHCSAWSRPPSRLGFSAYAWPNGDTYAFIERDGYKIHLSRSNKRSGNESPYLVKGTVAALEAEFRAGGVEVLYPLAPRPWKMKDVTISDPGGNQLHFGEDISCDQHTSQLQNHLSSPVSLNLLETSSLYVPDKVPLIFYTGTDINQSLHLNRRDAPSSRFGEVQT